MNDFIVKDNKVAFPEEVKKNLVEQLNSLQYTSKYIEKLNERNKEIIKELQQLLK